jgi:FAD binding domain
MAATYCCSTRTVRITSSLQILKECSRFTPDFFGGNSTKATSGINGALTRTQVDEKIGDSVKQFYEDTLKSARDKARPDLIKVLTYQSASAVEWLQDVFNLDLTLVSRLGYDPRYFSTAEFLMANSITAGTPSLELTVVMTPNFLAWPSRMLSCSVWRSS